MTNSKIPSDEQFSRASESIRARSRGLSDVRAMVLDRFKESHGLYEFFILDGAEDSFRAYVFYRWAREVDAAEESGLGIDIRNAVFDSLAAVGRGGRNQLRVDFEFDSHENVERNYDGNYFNRLH